MTAGKSLSKMKAQLVFLLMLLPSVYAHGRLTIPTPREWKEGSTCDFSGQPYISADERDNAKTHDCMEDPDAPININGDFRPESERLPVNDPDKHPGRQSLVCRVPNGYSSTPNIDVTAGQVLELKWELTAAHPGDGGLWISYDASFSNTQDMRFFKVANFPQLRLMNGKRVKVLLPSWLPPGQAVLRWDWYATHNQPYTEFFVNCVDINVRSSSLILPSSIQPSHKLETGTSSATSYPLYNDNSAWCWDCSGSDWDARKMNGPGCVAGISGNCCDLNRYSAVNYDEMGPGYDSCRSAGNSGNAPWVTGDNGSFTTDPSIRFTSKKVITVEDLPTFEESTKSREADVRQSTYDNIRITNQPEAVTEEESLTEEKENDGDWTTGHYLDDENKNDYQDKNEEPSTEEKSKTEENGGKRPPQDNGNPNSDLDKVYDKDDKEKHERTENEANDKHNEDGADNDSEKSKSKRDEQKDQTEAKQCEKLDSAEEQMKCCLRSKSLRECTSLAKQQLPANQKEFIDNESFCENTEDQAQIIRCCAMNKREDCPHGKGKLALLDCVAAPSAIRFDEEALCCFSKMRDEEICRTRVGTPGALPVYCNRPPQNLSVTQKMRCRGNGTDFRSGEEKEDEGARDKTDEEKQKFNPIDPIRITKAVGNVAATLPASGQNCIRAIAKAASALKTLLAQWHDDKPTEEVANDEFLTQQTVADLFLDLLQVSEQSDQLEQDFEQDNFDSFKASLGMPENKLNENEEPHMCKTEYATFRAKFDNIIEKFQQVPSLVAGLKKLKVDLSLIDLGSIDLNNGEDICAFAKRLIDVLRIIKSEHEQRLQITRKVLCEEAGEMLVNADLPKFAICLNTQARANRVSEEDADTKSDTALYTKAAAEANKLFGVVKRKCVAKSGDEQGVISESARLRNLTRRKITISFNKRNGTVTGAEREAIRSNIRKAVEEYDTNCENVQVTFKDEISDGQNLRRKLNNQNLEVIVTYDNTEATAVGTGIDENLQKHIGTDYNVQVQDESIASTVNNVNQPSGVENLPILEGTESTTKAQANDISRGDAKEASSGVSAKVTAGVLGLFISMIHFTIA